MQSEQQLYAALQNTADAILAFDAQARLSFLNPAGQKLFGDCEAKPGQRLVTGSGYDSFRQLLDQSRHSGTSLSGEVEWPDKRVFSASIIPDQEGGCFVTLHDVTRFKKQAKAKDEYIAALSHDLRSPITAIGGYSQLIAQVGPTNNTQKDFIQHIQNATASMNELVENMMNLATLDLGAHKEFNELRLGHLLWQLANEYQPQAEAKRQLLTIEKAQPNCVVRGDEMHLRQAFRNLIENAIKYTPEGGVIALSLYHDSDFVHFAIRDSGYGIPAVDLPHIFDRFYRVRNNGHDDIKGNGLGLAIVKSIAEQHGGEVTVESEPGKGSCFTVRLPCSYTEGLPQAVLKQEQEIT